MIPAIFTWLLYYCFFDHISTRAFYLSRFSQGGPTKFESFFFTMAKFWYLTILPIFDKIPEFSKNSQGRSLKDGDLIFWILALYIRIQAYVKKNLLQNPKWRMDCTYFQYIVLIGWEMAIIRSKMRVFFIL